MSLTIQRPGTVDVTKDNPPNVVYVKGNETTDGSVRYSIVVNRGVNVTEIQKRIGGLWQPTSFKTGANSVLVGTLISLSAAGTNLITTDDDGHTNFHVRSEVENGVATTLSNIINSFAFQERAVFRSDESSEFTGTTIEAQTIDNPVHLITQSFYFKTGATEATEPVRIQAWDGFGDTGLLIFDQTYSTLDFPSNTEIKLGLEGFLEFGIGANTLTRISSGANFSLKTNASVTEWWLAVDTSFVRNDDILQTTEWLAGENFTKGDWSTQNRKVYEANTTGIQTVTFDDNLDKWDQLISVQGFDRILTTISGEVVPDIIGNLVIGNQ